MSTVIRHEKSKDRGSIRQVNEAAFGRDSEANLVDALRAGGFVESSLIAVRDNQVVGHILFSRVVVRTEKQPVSVVSLAPMAVHPRHQRQGLGSELVRLGLEACRRQGHKITVVLGHPGFYPRFGFSAELAQSLENPFGEGDAWMALELEPGALDDIVGQVEYPPPFHEPL